MTKEELVKYLVANFTDKEGNLKLLGLDFRGLGLKRIQFEAWKMDCDYLSRHHYVKGNVKQDSLDIEGDLFQGFQAVSKDIVQDRNYAENIYQGKNDIRKNSYYQKDKISGRKFDTTDW